MIVLVSGLPGSGKSYFAERLAKAIHAEYINSDQLRKELFTKRVYSNFEKSAVYDAMLKRMEEASSAEKNVVVDATFHKKFRRDLFSARANQKIRFIEVWADEEIIRQRLKKTRPYSEADFTVYKLISHEWEPFEEDHLLLQSTNDNIDEMLLKAMKYLKDDGTGNR